MQDNIHGDAFGPGCQPTASDASASSRSGIPIAVCAHCAACEPWLKEEETPAERIERECRDTQALMKLLELEKRKTWYREIAHEPPPQTGLFLLWSPDHPEHAVPVRADIYYGSIEREHQGRQPKHLSFSHFTHWLPTPLPYFTASAIEARRAETGTGSVADESAVAESETPQP